MRDDLASNVVEFCSRLRTEHGFVVGLRETREAVRAIETVGVGERARVAAALRSICCSRPEDIAVFAAAFDAFFSSETQGVPQPAHARRRARPSSSRREERDGVDAHRPERRPPQDDLDDGGALHTTAHPEGESLAESWRAMQARYSPEARTAPESPSIPTEGLDAALADANRLVRRLRLGRSLRWKPQPRGTRFDLRRTLRASLRTGGDVVATRMLGHPLRNPRFVLLLDGSRSMNEYAGRMLQFAHALCRRTRRASAFVFSTQLQDVTRDLRAAGRNGSYRLAELGEAWGGGTRIGASLSEFVHRFGALLSDQTLVIVISDGLDAGDIVQLKRALREIARRSASIAWVNPHAAEPGYAPTAGGMQAAMPYVTTLSSLEGLSAIARA
jgi:uncharacterized protein